MTNEIRNKITRRDVIKRLTSLGLTVPAATALFGTSSLSASADKPIRISFANVFEKGELFVQLGNGIEAAAKQIGYDFRRYKNEFDG